MEEVYAPGKWNSHLSDDVAAFALAHNAADRQAPPAAGEGVPRTSYVSRSQRELTYGPGEPALRTVGEVRMVEEEMNPYVINGRRAAGRVHGVGRPGEHAPAT